MFNLRAKRSAMDALRGLGGDCERLRPSDLDGLSEQDMKDIVWRFKDMQKRASIASKTITAVHGVGETWWEATKTPHPAVSDPPGWEFGGERRDEHGAFTGAGDLKLDYNTEEGKAPEGKTKNKDQLNRLLNEVKGSQFVVRLRLSEEDQANTDFLDRVAEMFGEEKQTDKDSIFMMVNGYENAIAKQKEIPGSQIEAKGE